MELLQEITRCPLIQAWFASPQSPNPCAKIIAIQHMDLDHERFGK
jgi:hypothetical protein